MNTRNLRVNREGFPKVLHRNLDDFYADFLAWTQQQIAGWGYDEATSKKYDDLKQQADAYIKPRDYDKVELSPPD